MDSKAAALQELHLTGNVRLPGKTAPSSCFGAVAGAVLLLLIVASAASMFDAQPLTSGEVCSWDKMKVLATLLLMPVAIVATMVTVGRDFQYRRAERKPVILDESGLTLRGVGPLAWENFAPARRSRVAVSGQENEVIRDVIPLTATGVSMVNRRLRARERRVLNPAYVNGSIDHIYLPVVKGLQPDDMIDVFNTALARYGR